MSTFKLVGGDLIPLIGFGTYRIRGRALIKEVLDYALAAGYRLIDSAVVYGNEEDIGEALKDLLPKYQLKRQDIFVTSKLPPNLQGDVNAILGVIKSSLEKLQVSYIDLYLIHWPGQQGASPHKQDNGSVRDRTWQALVEAKKREWVKNIGVSNYTVPHLQELLNNCHGVVPAVNQVEWHPYWHQIRLKELCDANNIFLQAYCSLGGTSDPHILLSDATLTQIAIELNQPPAAILLKWALQQNIGVIPKSLKRPHIESNIKLDFTLSDEDMLALNNLNQVKFAWDPEVVS